MISLYKDINISENVLTDLIHFGKCLLHTEDLDPVYPLMYKWLANKNASMEERLWAIFVYMNWYSLPSTIYIFDKWNTYSQAWNDSGFYQYIQTEGNNLPIGMERRGFRGGRLGIGMTKSMKYLGDIFLQTYIEKFLIKDPYQSRKNIEKGLQKIPNWGTWASFKICDLLQYVAGYKNEIKCPDMSLKGRTQYEAFKYILATDNKNIEDLNEAGFILAGLVDKQIPNITQDILETMICKFHAICGGFYAIGQDIWDDKERLEKIEKKYGNTYWIEEYKSIKVAVFRPYFTTQFFTKPDKNAYKNGKIECPICNGYDRLWYPEGKKLSRLCKYIGENLK